MHNGELILLVWNDLVGLCRTRGVPVSQYERRKAHGLGWALAGQSLTPFEDIAPQPVGTDGRGPPDSRRRISLRDDMPPLHMVLCNSLNTDGTPWECCTRSFMQAALDDLKTETGLDLHIAYENEFLLTGDDMVWASPPSPWIRSAASRPSPNSAQASCLTRMSGLRPSSRSTVWANTRSVVVRPSVWPTPIASSSPVRSSRKRPASRAFARPSRRSPRPTPSATAVICI